MRAGWLERAEMSEAMEPTSEFWTLAGIGLAGFGRYAGVAFLLWVMKRSDPSTRRWGRF